jgi:hypothetical protein
LTFPPSVADDFTVTSGLVANLVTRTLLAGGACAEKRFVVSETARIAALTKTRLRMMRDSTLES